MPRRKGWKCSDEVKKNMSAGALKRESRIIKRYGMDQVFYRFQISLGKRWCSDCKAFKDGSEFGKSTTRCLACQRVRNNDYHRRNADDLNRKRREYFVQNRTREIEKRRIRGLAAYGVSSEWYEAKSAEQNHACAICHKPEAAKRGFAVDHDHTCCSGKKRACSRCRRGLLCGACNLALGRAEAHGWIEAASAYLRRYALK